MQDVASSRLQTNNRSDLYASHSSDLNKSDMIIYERISPFSGCTTIVERCYSKLVPRSI